MEERKTIFDYIGQVFMIFGITIGIINIFCLLFGDEAQGYSTMFALGHTGIPTATIMQFFLAAVFTVSLRFVFFTETFIKKMSVPYRALCMVLSEVAVIFLFILTCGWFPVDEWLPWVTFFISFAICFVCSVAVTTVRERMENKRMKEALERLKRGE
ncbi:MAG: hypothetical protein K2P65_13895 [Lachnospiraceae bacterium]|nr:hypothetical protein [Lachnospiraceae bacterium]